MGKGLEAMLPLENQSSERSQCAKGNGQEGRVMRGSGSEFHRIMWPHSCLKFKTQRIPCPHLLHFIMVAIGSCQLTIPP